jgi:hypothetical protein
MMAQHSEIAAGLIILIGYYSIMMIASIIQAKAAKKAIALRHAQQSSGL